jgi:hypothetical protein
MAIDSTGARIAAVTGGAARGGVPFSAIRILDATSGRPLGNAIDAFEYEDVGAIALSPDGRIIATAGGGRRLDGVREAVASQIGFWDAATGKRFDVISRSRLSRETLFGCGWQCDLARKAYRVLASSSTLAMIR